MDVDLAQELLNALGSSLENLETQQAALVQFLKDNGSLTDDQFAPYLAQAAKASSVRWRAAHMRLESLFAAEQQKEEKLRENQKHQTTEAQSSGQQSEGATSAPVSAIPGPWTAEAKTSGAPDASPKQSATAKEGKPDERPASEDNKPNPASKTA